MPLVPFDKHYRRTWMFPRNIRDIAPWKLAQIMSVLNAIAQEGRWQGNQGAQHRFNKALETAGLKRAGHQRDSHSGGARTYAAQLVSLGLIFKGAGYSIQTTQAGNALLSGANPLPILQRQLLRVQFPSSYSVSPHVGVHPSLKVKPFLFVLELLAAVGSLNNDELAIAVLYGHQHDCVGLCADKVRRMQGGAELESQIADWEKDTYTPRSDGRTKDFALADVRNIANTCKNYIEATRLIDIDKIDGVERFTRSKAGEKIFQEELARRDDFILQPEREESFQRKFGLVAGVKDTRAISTEAPSDPAIPLIQSLYFRYVGATPVDGVPPVFKKELLDGYGFNASQVDRALRDIAPKSLNYFESTYLGLAQSGGGSDALEFERATAELFRLRLNFEAALTGQRRRAQRGGAYADIFVVELSQRHCGIIDTKASPSYKLSSGDFQMMANNYAPNYRELCGGRDLKLEFALYVAGGFGGNIASATSDLKARIGVPVSAIAAADLLAVCQNPPDQETVRGGFRDGGLLGVANFGISE